MIKSINIKNCVIIFIFLMIKSINITKSIICVIIVFFIFIMIISIIIKNSIICVVIIFIFIIIKSLGAFMPNPELGLDASASTSKPKLAWTRPCATLSWAWTRPLPHPRWAWKRPRPTWGT